METRELTCIGCPLGCALTVTMNGKEVVEVKGTTCKKGDIYARKEVTNPTRIVTTTVRVSGGAAPMINLKTQSDIPKDKIFACEAALKGVTLRGFKYPLERHTTYFGESLCVSNELEAEEGFINIEEGMAFLIESRD